MLQTTHFQRLLAKLCTVILFFRHVSASTTFFPFQNMTDTSGNPIQAHGGAILQGRGKDTSWYWFGEDKTGETTSGSFIGVTCYKSSDLSSWSYLGHVLSPIAGTNISSTSVVERPKILYNAMNDEYVMWFHSDNAGYSAAMVGVATSKTISGKYTWRGSFRPFGQDSRDMTVWQDPDSGAGYLIFATNGNKDLEIASLTSDYHGVSKGLYTFFGVYQEAPGVLKINGAYYLLYSPQDGWTPTANAYYKATSMSGPWSASTQLAPSNAYTYLTQNAYDITIKGSQTTTYLYYGDHWSGNFLGTSTYSFLPINFNSSALSLHNTGGWTLNLATGTWTDLQYTLITAAKSSTRSSSLVACSDSCAGGRAASMTSSQTFSFTWSGTAGRKTLQILYTYNGPKNVFKHISATVDGTAAKGNALLETTRGSDFAQQAPLPVTLAAGSKVVLSLLDYDGTPFLVDGVKVYDS